MPKPFAYRFFLPLLLLSILCAKAQTHFEKGHIPVQNYLAGKHFQGLAQNWVVAQDSLGLIYVGNTQNILQYDGEIWRTIEVNDGAAVRGLVHYKGKMYVGTSNDFGELVCNKQGQLQYHSLKIFTEDIGQVWSLFVVGEELVIVSTDFLIYFNPISKQIHKLKLPFAVQIACQIDSLVFCMNEDKQVLLVENKKVRFLFFPEFKGQNKYIKNILDYSPDHYLVISSFGPFYLLHKKNFSLSPFPVLTEKLRDRLYIEHATKHQGNLLLGTKNSGFLQINDKQELVNFYNTSNQLQDNYVHYTFVDAQGNVWLALNNGISVVKIQADISFLDQSYGFEGIIEGISRHQGRLHLATHRGFFSLHTHTQQDIAKAEDMRPQFKQIRAQSITTQCWALLPMRIEPREYLLGITNSGVWDLTNSNQVQLILPGEAYCLSQSAQDPRRIYVGVHDGLRAIYLQANNTWKLEDYLFETSDPVYKIAQHQGKIYAGTYDIDSLLVYNTSSRKKAGISLPAKHAPVFPLQYQGKILLGTAQGIYAYNPIDATVYKEPTFNYFLPDTAAYIHRMSIDTKGRLWLVIYDNIHKKVEVGFFKQFQGRTIWVSEPFNDIEQGDIHAVLHEPEGITWLGGQNGLFRFDENELTRYRAPFNTQIRQVVLNNDSTVFWGHFVNAQGTTTLTQPESMRLKIAYDYNSPTFYFAAQDYENADSKLYSYFLEGYSTRWSPYHRENKAVFTNLTEGTYTFKVKAKNRYDQLSDVATYTFTILPPWYRTWWAYLLFLLLGIALIFTAVYFYTRNLRQIIQARTAEIREQKEIIEAKNRDILSSIDYAQKIQQALLPSNQVLRSIFKDSLVVFFPRDVVSGDFYWVGKKGENTCFSLMDCTGHGVPGAFMSMIGNSLLNELILEKGLTTPSVVLDSMKKNIKQSLSQQGGEHRRDGMDAALCSLDRQHLTLEYAGANTALYIFRNDAHPLIAEKAKKIEPILVHQNLHVYEVKPDKMPVGYFDDQARFFTNHSLQMQVGDRIYLFTDGFPDQFGGEKGKKYKRSLLLQFFMSIQAQSLVDQRQTLTLEFERWRGSYEQVDDVSILAIEV